MADPLDPKALEAAQGAVDTLSPAGARAVVASYEQAAHPSGLDQSHHILNGLREIVGAAEEAGWDLTDNRDTLNAGREAYAIACAFFGVAPIEGNGRHEPVPDDAL